MSSHGALVEKSRDDKETPAVNIDHNSDSGPDASNRESEDHTEVDGDYGSYHDHIFVEPKIAAYWANVYENARYEGRHRFDPAFTWSAPEEKRLKRKASFPVFEPGVEKTDASF